MLQEPHSARIHGTAAIAGAAYSPASPTPSIPSPAPAKSLSPQRQIDGSLSQSIFHTQQWLIGQQHSDGYWVAELEGDTILESEFLLLLAYLGEERTPLAMKCAEYLLEKQTPEGFWTQYPGGDIDISATVKAYFSLKLTGHDPAS